MLACFRSTPTVGAGHNTCGAAAAYPCLRRHMPRTASSSGSPAALHDSKTAAQQHNSSSNVVETLTGFVGAHTTQDGSQLQPAEATLLFAALQLAIKTIAAKVARAGIDQLYGYADAQPLAQGRDKPKKLDLVTNDIMKSILVSSGQVAVMASEEDDYAIEATQGAPYVLVFDPLDGSRNIDAGIPTGTIFGVYAHTPGATALEDVLQPGQQLLASGYALYSSAIILVLSLGPGTGAHAFTLDPTLGEFVLTQRNLKVPPRGQIYSVNDARYHDWPRGLQRYIDDIRQGRGRSGKQYSARYICALVADFHRALMYGGLAMNPRSHLRLVYEANPLALLAEEAGGRGSDGKRRVLSIQPEKLHQRLPLFLGSPEDVEELESYGDVQQLGTKTYEV